MTNNTPEPPPTYEADLYSWREDVDARLRRDDGWLTLAGLHWLHNGTNSLGSDPGCDIPLPPGHAPAHLGVIDFRGGVATLRLADPTPVMVDEQPAAANSPIILRDDTEADGPSVVQCGGVSFFVIKREAEYGIRVRDLDHPARQVFPGRQWYAPALAYRVAAAYTPHPTPRQITIINSVGIPVPMNNPGRVAFTLHGQALALEAFEGGPDQLWFIFKDATNGVTTYGAGRFLTAEYQAGPDTVAGTVILDFNRAYSPPCAFTPYATCPLPPKENVLPVQIAAGERHPATA